jgi:hypothetical protein
MSDTFGTRDSHVLIGRMDLSSVLVRNLRDFSPFYNAAGVANVGIGDYMPANWSASFDPVRSKLWKPITRYRGSKYASRCCQ